MDLLILCYCIAFTLFYFLPAIVGRKKANSNAIFLLNLLLGWSVIGWIIALVWATTTDPLGPTRPASASPTDSRIMQLKALRDAGNLTQAEFMGQLSQLMSSPAQNSLLLPAIQEPGF